MRQLHVTDLYQIKKHYAGRMFLHNPYNSVLSAVCIKFGSLYLWSEARVIVMKLFFLADAKDELSAELK